MKILTYILKTVWLTLWFELRSATDDFAQCFMKLFSKIKKAWVLSLITFFFIRSPIFYDGAEWRLDKSSSWRK